MSNHSLHTFPIPSWFNSVLTQLGQNWDDPNTQNPVVNVEAHNVLPKRNTEYQQLLKSEFELSQIPHQTGSSITPVAVYPVPTKGGHSIPPPPQRRRLLKNAVKSKWSWFGLVCVPFFPFIVPIWWQGKSSGAVAKLIICFLILFAVSTAVGAAEEYDEFDPRLNHPVILHNLPPSQDNPAENSAISSKPNDATVSRRVPMDHHPDKNVVVDKAQPVLNIPQTDPVQTGIDEQHGHRTMQPSQRLKDEVVQTNQPAVLHVQLDGRWTWIIFAMIPTLALIPLSVLMAAYLLRTAVNSKGSTAVSPVVDVRCYKSNEEQLTLSKFGSQNAVIRWKSAGASRTGLVRQENQDAFASCNKSTDYSVLVVCDGVGGEPGGKEAAEFASQFCLKQIQQNLNADTPATEICAPVLANCRKAFISQSVNGLTTAIIAICKNDQMHYAALGDGALDIIHSDGMIQNCLAPHHALDAPSNVITAFLSAKENRDFIPRQGTVRCEPGSMVLAMTDGASDLLPTKQIAAKLSDYKSKCDQQGIEFVANQLLLQIEQAIDEETGIWLHSDNMTLAIAVSELAPTQGAAQ